MDKFLKILVDIDKDVNFALKCIVKAGPILALTPQGAEAVAVATAILDFEAKLGLTPNT